MLSERITKYVWKVPEIPSRQHPSCGTRSLSTCLLHNQMIRTASAIDHYPNRQPKLHSLFGLQNWRRLYAKVDNRAINILCDSENGLKMPTSSALRRSRIHRNRLN